MSKMEAFVYLARRSERLQQGWTAELGVAFSDFILAGTQEEMENRVSQFVDLYTTISAPL